MSPAPRPGPLDRPSHAPTAAETRTDLAFCCGRAIRKSIAAFPIDHIAQWPAVDIRAQVVAEEVDGAVPVFVAGARDVRRDQRSGVGPELPRRQVLEFADIDVECGTAQVTAFESVGQGILIDNFAARNIDQHAARLHPAKALVVEQTVGLLGPLAANYDKIARRQVAVEIVGPTELTKPL